MASNAVNTTSVVVWAYSNHCNLWCAYEPQVSQEIEKAHSNRTLSKLNLGTINPALSCYEIDLVNLTQVQLNTGKNRQIQRQIHPINSALGNRRIWEFEGDYPGKWVAYDLETLALIHDAFLKYTQGASPILDLIKLPYRIDLANLTQIRINTGTVRKIRQRNLNQSYSANTTGGIQSFLSSTLPLPSLSGCSSSSVSGSSQAMPNQGKIKRSKTKASVKHHPYNSNGHHAKVSAQQTGATQSSYPSLGSATRGKHSVKSQGQTSGQMCMMSNLNVLQQPFQLAMQSMYIPPLTLSQPQGPLNSLSQFPVGYHPLNGVTGPLLQALPQPLTESLPRSFKITITNKPRKSMSGQEVLGRYMTRVHTDLDKTDCAICCEKLSEASSYGDGQSEAHEAIQLCRCNHQFHKLCLLTMYNSNHKDDSLQCPSCKMIYGEMTGICPPGDMTWKILSGHSLAGYEGYNTICVTYHLSPGIQGPEHPQPGQPYTCRGFPRQGFLPDCDKGRKVLKLLMEAFKRRLMFTIATSHTTGEANTVTWNEIHHKTEPHGNLSGHGYPDPNYLDNVLQELAAYGITEDCLKTTQS